MTPYIFQPINVERPWGGRRLAELFGRDLPEGVKIGEIWDLVDRPEANNAVLSGPGVSPGSGLTLHDLWQELRAEVFGTDAPDTPRFPILIKLLDAAENVCVQVHPKPGPGLEPKTEMWYFLETAPDAKIYAGFQRGVTRARFEDALGRPGLPELLHPMTPHAGDALYLPSGRIHALTAGSVFLEVQQNSVTTYRIDDWGYVDAQGQPRELHLPEALRSINFDDYEPDMLRADGEHLLDCPFFAVDRAVLSPGEERVWAGDTTSFQYQFLARGALQIGSRAFPRGASWLVPAQAEGFTLRASGEGAEVVTVHWGQASQG